MGQETFPESVVAAAQASARATGVSASVTLAQWALESDYGRSMPTGSNNPFGMKATAGQASVSVPTHEYVGGRFIRVVAAFRKFNTIQDAFMAHGQLIANGKPYQKIHGIIGDPERLAHALQGLYATDPTYSQQLLHIMNQHDLWRYDAAPTAAKGA